MANELVSIKGSTLRLNLHPGQTKAWDSERRFVFAIAGTQGGKTTFGPWWLHREIERCGPGDYLAVSATYDLFKLKMLPEMLRVFGTYIPGWEYHKTDRVIHNNGTRIILRAATSEGGLESATAKAAWLDECGQDDFGLGAWEAVQRRLSLSQGRVLGSTTVYNLGWLYTEVYRRWRDGDPDFYVTQFESIMNPSFPVEEFERARRTLPKWKFEMQYRGNFTRPAGMIYEDYDENIHRIAPRNIPPEFPVYVGIDPGAVNTAGIWIAQDPVKNVYYLFRETLEGDKTTKQHARQALDFASQRNVIAWALGAKSETQQRMDWIDAGVPVQEPEVSDVEGGIDRVIELFKTKRLFIFSDCTGILDEIGTYSRELDEYGQPTEKIKNKERYHRLDALRYCVQLFTTAHWLMT